MKELLEPLMAPDSAERALGASEDRSRKRFVLKFCELSVRPEGPHRREILHSGSKASYKWDSSYVVL